MKIRELLWRLRLRRSKQEEGERLVDSEERSWVEYMPSQQDERPE